MRSAWLVVAMIGCCASVASAQSRVVVRPFTGPGSARAREAVVQSLSDQQSIELMKDTDVRSAASEVGADVSTGPGRVMVARKLVVSAFIEGESRKQGRGFEVEIRVYEGRNGALLETTTVNATQAKLPRQVRDQFVRDLGLVIAHAKPPEPQAEKHVASRPQPAQRVAPEPREEPEPIPGAKDEGEAEPEAEPEADDDSAAKLPALELDVTVPLLLRSYKYTEDPTENLARHKLALTPALRIGARWYPGAHFTHGVAANIGLDVYGQVMWPVKANSDTSSDTFETSSSAFGIAARFRVPVGDHQIGFVAGYGQHSLGFDKAKSGTPPAVPDVKYGFVRLGADARLMLTEAIALKIAAAYLLVQGYGQLGDSAWYPHVSGGGFEAAIGAGYALSPLLELNAGFGLTRYFMSLHPELMDAGVQDHLRIAGGIEDQYVAILLGLTLRF